MIVQPIALLIVTGVFLSIPKKIRREHALPYYIYNINYPSKCTLSTTLVTFVQSIKGVNEDF